MSRRVIVIGGGVAGPVLAMALRRIGDEVLVFERDESVATERGSWLNFQANGMDALEAIDAAGTAREIGFPVTRIGFVNGRGRSLGQMPMAGPRTDGQVSMMMRRGELYAALGEAARARGVEIVHGRRLIEAEETAAGVRARFADGSVTEGDLLVGCDGIHSRVRTIIDSQAPAPRYVPVLNVGGYVPGLAVDVPAGEFRMQFGSRCFFAWTPTPDGGTVWFANPPMAREPERGVLSGIGDGEWREWLHELMAGDAGPSHEIIDAAPGPLIGWATYDMPVVRRWSSERMIVIGDAAHATAPSAGQGAAMALEDAVILAQCLRDRHDPPAAFAAFEALRRERVQRIVKHGARSSNSKAAGPVGRVLRDALLPIVFRRACRDGGRSMGWLQGHHIDFERPIAV